MRKKKRYNLLEDLAQLERDIKAGLVCPCCGVEKPLTCSCKKRRVKKPVKVNKIHEVPNEYPRTETAHTQTIESSGIVPERNERPSDPKDRENDSSPTESKPKKSKLDYNQDYKQRQKDQKEGQSDFNIWLKGFLERLGNSGENEVPPEQLCQRCKIYEREEDSIMCLSCNECVAHQKEFSTGGDLRLDEVQRRHAAKKKTNQLPSKD